MESRKPSSEPPEISAPPDALPAPPMPSAFVERTAEDSGSGFIFVGVKKPPPPPAR